ncbi:MAG: diaminopimelate decarboxylase [Prevotellaceae bacterium]|jgi:diaminopimelate decarboxylase|nr:diaminopimelate decarboxylase [Prevotellaceae bacterium]
MVDRTIFEDRRRWLEVTTPFYYYDVDLLKLTVATAKKEADKRGYILHYALKANANPRLLKIIFGAGFGADCVSGNEIFRALEYGAKPDSINFAGVGKSDIEIKIGLYNHISVFNCESIPEIENINLLAKLKGKAYNIGIRINPDVDAKTHEYISTGKKENKFGIPAWDFDQVIEKLKMLKYLRFTSLHFHIGSQITDMNVFAELCQRVNTFNQWFKDQGFELEHINVGGGLGVDYQTPYNNPVPDFATYFSVFEKNLKLFPGQKLHFEPGRSIVAQCGSLVTRTLYVKEGRTKDFVIVDAGMTDLIRPALYQAYHYIENLSSEGPEKVYDVVGPICESSDCFGKDVRLPETKRGNFIALHSAGAYGEVMASQYNLRELPKTIFSDEITKSEMFER